MFRDFPSPNILSACPLNNFLLARGGRLDKPPFQVRPRFPTLSCFDGVPNHLDSQKLKTKSPPFILIALAQRMSFAIATRR
jgi:hypothetical protein